MEFHAEFFPKPFLKKINLQHKLMLIGSCFTEQIGSKLAAHKFKVLENPNGILFNPVSIAKAITSYAAGRLYTKDDLFHFNELWASWQHHSRFSHIDKEIALQKINESHEKANAFIKDADWLLITLGSAFVYENTHSGTFEVVANCHKVPADKFYRRLLDAIEIRQVLQSAIETVRAVNPSMNFILTISPVRHLREGFIENNQSKAALIQAVHSLVENERIFYFPSYELVIDDLRDYRFYAEDMVHPNYAATNYVWEKFSDSCIDDQAKKLMKEIAVITAAKNHKPFNPTSEQHKNFLAANLVRVRKMTEQYPFINLNEEQKFFESAGDKNNS